MVHDCGVPGALRTKKQKEALVDFLQVADPEDAAQIRFPVLHFEEEAMDHSAHCEHHPAQDGDQRRQGAKCEDRGQLKGCPSRARTHALEVLVFGLRLLLGGFGIVVTPKKRVLKDLGQT